MIFAALVDLHEQLRAEGRVPRQGYSFENIGGEIVLGKDGSLLEVNVFLRKEGSRLLHRRMEVPAACVRTSGIEANLLWDKTSYALGVTARKDAKKKDILDEDKQKLPSTEGKTAQRHNRFWERNIHLFGKSGDAGAKALSAFLGSWDPESYLSVFPAELIDENLVFRLEGDVHTDGTPRFIHERPDLVTICQGVEKTLPGDRVCGITGETARCIDGYPRIKGIKGGQGSGVYMSSFNFETPESYGLKKAENAPVSAAVATKAAAALNTLLDRDGGQKVILGDTTIVYWLRPDAQGARSARGARAAIDLEHAFLHGAGGWIDSTETTLARVTGFFEALKQGTLEPGAYEGMTFCMLGLSAADARLRVRFYREEPPLALMRRILAHREALALEGQRSLPRPRHLLEAISRKNRSGRAMVDELSPHLGRDLGQAILTGAPYPHAMLPAVLTRIHSDKGSDKVTLTRVALLKAILSRMPRQEGIPMGLDPNSQDPGYQLGRLFALIEGTQRAARPDIKSTIRDRLMSAASKSPGSIFPKLLRDAQPNMSKMRKKDQGGLAVWFDRRIAEVLERLQGEIPRTLSLPEQARFFAGYYQQAHMAKAKEDLVEKDDEE